MATQTKIKMQRFNGTDYDQLLPATTIEQVDGLQTALNAKQSTITGGASTIVSSNLTASRALISDGNGKVSASAVTSTELGYIDGVTSNVQTQINAKYAKPSGGIPKTDLASAVQTSLGKADVSVLYTASQSLTDAQKQQARENINAPAPYTAGQNISISGTTIGTKALPCNPNLLDNWYFGNPVNQRGQTSYTGNIYGIDRWYTDALSVTVGDGYLRLNRDSSDLWFSRIMQKLEIALSKEIANKTCTLSALVKSVSTQGQCLLSIFNITDDVSSTSIYAALSGRVQLITVTFVVPSSYSGKQLGAFLYPDVSDAIRSNGCDVYAVKLELGSEQTLAHQDANGNWVLNEIPDYGEQLRRCQRYYYKTASAPYSSYTIRAASTDYLIGACIFPVTMRTTPSVQILSYRSPTTGEIIAAEASASQITSDGFCVIADDGKFLTETVFQVNFSASADL